MKCNNCGSDMQAALYHTEGWGEKLIVLGSYNPSTGKCEVAGWIMYCPECGCLQLDLRRQG